jgi:glycosyltransferase involved in cell wall biosynthesis
MNKPKVSVIIPIYNRYYPEFDVVRSIDVENNA